MNENDTYVMLLESPLEHSPNCRCVPNELYSIKNEIIAILKDHFGAMPVKTLQAELTLRLPIKYSNYILYALEDLEHGEIFDIFTTRNNIKWIYLKQKENTSKNPVIDNPKNTLELLINSYDANGEKKELMLFRLKDFAAGIIDDISIYDLKDFVNDGYDEVIKEIIRIENFTKLQSDLKKIANIPFGIAVCKP